MKKILIIMLIFTGLLTFGCSKKEKSNDIIPDKNIIYIIPNGYKEFYSNHFYYLPENDLSGKSGSIGIETFESDREYSKEYIEELKEEYKDYNIKTIEPYKTSEYKGVYMVLSFEKYDEIIYHLLSGYTIVVVDGLDYHVYPNFSIDVKSIVDSMEI